MYQAADVWKDFLQIVAIDESNVPEIPAIHAIRIYPNPVSDYFRIGGIEEDTIVTIVDITGKTMLQQPVNPDETIVVSYLQQGIYFVMVKGKTEKMVKM